MSTIDRDYAPAGFYAIGPVGYAKNGRPLCTQCAFRVERENGGSVCTLPELTCIDGTRPDGENVIFLPKESTK